MAHEYTLTGAGASSGKNSPVAMRARGAYNLIGQNLLKGKVDIFLEEMVPRQVIAIGREQITEDNYRSFLRKNFLEGYDVFRDSAGGIVSITIANPYISDVHAVLCCDAKAAGVVGKEFNLLDAGSVNGTYMNGRKIGIAHTRPDANLNPGTNLNPSMDPIVTSLRDKWLNRYNNVGMVILREGTVITLAESQYGKQYSLEFLLNR